MKLNWGERLAVNNPLRPWQQRVELALLKDHLPICPGARILEIGCGRGAGARLIDSLFRPSRIYATDLDVEMIRMACDYLSPGDRRGITFLTVDATWLPFAGGSMDAVFGFGVLHHIPDWQAALREIVRVLPTGGIYFFEELFPTLYQNALTKRFLLHPEENRFDSLELREEMGLAGFELGRCIEVPLVGIIGVATKR